MSGVQNKPIRSSSARAPAIRPQSSKNRKVHQKTQFIQNLYGPNNPSGSAQNYHSFQKNKLLFNRANLGDSEMEDISKLLPRPQQMNKQRQELFQQNLHLKKQLNKMKDQIMKNRTKIQTLTSKNYKYTKQFNRQFEKKIYWNGNNTYLISGVKAQYQKLKQQFTQKQHECEALKRELIESRAPQFKIYAQTLQEQNKKLNQRINKMAEVSQNILFDNSNDNKTYPQYMYAELQNKLEKLDQKLKQAQFDVRSYKQQNKDLHKKIEFIQKLLIQKDNAQYHASKKAKKLQRQKNAMQQRLRQLQFKNQQISKNSQAKIEKLKILEEKRFKAEKDIFDRTLIERDMRIQKLEKEVAYLSTLLTYWKPLDELNKQSNQKLFNNDNEQFSQNSRQSKQKKKNQQSFTLDQKNLGNSTKMRRQSQFQYKGGDFIIKPSQQIQNGLKQSGVMQAPKKTKFQQTADKRFSQEAQKKRRVDFKQIQHLGQHLKYRFLGLRLPINEIKTYFDYKKGSSNPEANFVLSPDKSQKQQSDNVWQQQYITMRQTKQILKSSPFQLGDEQAHILARYMIEDSTNEYVYCDLNNQHKRSVIKSIIKAIVGDYQILSSQRQIIVEKQCRQMLDKYQANMISALSAMASSGYISRKKFIQLINSLGIQLSQQGRDLLVCRMLLKSQSLNKLSYMIIFD